MKRYLFLCVGLLLAAISVQAQTIIPSANKITYTTNTVEVADSVAKVSIVVRKNDLRVRTRGTGTGAEATLVDKASGRAVWSGPVSKVRIVGVTTSDSLKVISLKTTPFN
ncbi:hypothetical protein GGR92_005265 [Spirosoma lacussanchae]|uniref:hypothetical protein n=1 Tax=Spirosoma lacussanchae TaxID=1884249 RepID=UPI0011083B35|nr:hypothetical protein [Spirosoma lacussanchae]